jgi:Fungalysin metallopeptidase (M36)/Fungalysin/Thermolysin Propeptide Motif
MALAAGLLAALAIPPLASGASRSVAATLRTASAPPRELRQVAAIPLPGGATVYRYQQRVDGVRVLNGQAVVSDPADGPPALVADASRRGIEPPPSPRVGKGRAIGIASRGVGVTRLRGRTSAALAIDPDDGGGLVWRVLVPSARPLGDFEVLVDALSGHLVHVSDRLQPFRTGRAKLYDPNPVAERHSFFGGLQSDHHDRNTKLLTSLRVPVRLRNISEDQDCLRGRWAHAKVGRRPPHDVCKASLRWNSVKRAKGRFEALMAYYHVDRAQNYIQSLGFSDGTANGIDDRAQVTVADAFKDDNSFYSPFTRKIEVGSGGVDDAEDADVILHEYGHSIQDDEAPGFGDGPQAGAIGEGFGDYWAAVMSSLSPNTTNADDVCIFDWDGVSWGRFAPPFHRKCGRRADVQRTLPQAQANCRLEIHCVGEVWSSALWSLRTSYGINAVTFDRIVLSSQFMYVSTERFDAAVDALVDADQAVTGGLNKTAICTEMDTKRAIPASACS